MSWTLLLIAVTTDRLIKLAPAKANAHGDDTHKLVVENFPFNVLGWNDKSKTFHPSIGALCSHIDHIRMPDCTRFGKKNMDPSTPT